MKKIMKVAILGDSISQGLGSKLYNYSNNLKKNLEDDTEFKYHIKNFAYTGTTIYYANKICEEVKEYNPDIVISFYGNVDAMIRPKTERTNGLINFYSLLPARYKKNGMLDPRPFFSSNKYRRILEKIDSLIRYNLKKVLLVLQGEYCWVEINDFKQQYSCFLENINNGKRMIFIVSTVTVNEKYFPGTNENFEKYNLCMKEISKTNGVYFINLNEELKKYNFDEIYGNDHFHPNKNGYSIISNYFSQIISEQLLRERM